ncbi:MAG: hypothetical protein JST58_03005 [Bacteroidetes bacterium]|nr:hypothetical protein [Bacteroidota bacterium]
MSNKNKHKKQPQSVEYKTDASTDLSLDLVAQKRTGGAINIRGIRFQTLYSIHTILSHLQPESKTFVQLEGIEDIDLHTDMESVFIQIKTSQNTIDANRLWELKILQNFYEVFVIDSNSQFLLVHNTSFQKGNLDAITGNSPSSQQIEFWLKKFTDSSIAITKTHLEAFLNKITLFKTSETELLKSIKSILLSKFDININAENLFLKALFYFVLEQSKLKAQIQFQDIAELIQNVKDAISKGPVNPAVKNNWINPIVFELNEKSDDLSYFDGKSARPSDIANKLPVERITWETQIIDSVGKFDITVIRSSSGQGKSTLAWQACLKLTAKGYTIFQLNYCPDWDTVVAIKDFISSRLTIGQVPVIVIDGLNNTVSAWSTLAENLRGIPVKFIVTARQEDWVRYGGDLSNISLKLNDILLSMQEAKNIFTELKKHDKLHSPKTLWQPAWEKISEKGLLIEYVYLLTRGEMLHNRLYQQVQVVSKEQGAIVKLDLLRIICTADILNIRLKTNTVSQYLNTKFQRTVDLNELYRQLENEYYLKFGDTFIEGLHPVRSSHLQIILHSHIPPDETLLDILRMIDEKLIYDFFMNVSLRFPLLTNGFFENAAKIMVTRKPSEMVFAIDGLMYYEPIKYWNQNRSTFDSAAASGGIELFVYDSVPFNKLNILEKFSQSLSEDMNGNIKNLLAKSKALGKYSFAESNILIFTQSLCNELTGKNIQIKDYEGLTFLFKWFKRLGLHFPEFINFEDAQILKFFNNRPIAEVSDMCSLYHLIKPEHYKTFVATNKQQLFSYIKKETQTLSIYEKDKNIHFEYLLDNDADKVNEMSVYRINMAFAFLPFYEHYCTDIIILPFPNEQLYKAVIQNAHKEIPAKNVYDSFDTHLNRIWSKAILDKYSYDSAYEWQDTFFTYRTKAISLVKEVTYFFEAHLKGEAKKVNSQLKTLMEQVKDFLHYDTALKRYPSSTKKHFEDDKNKPHIGKIDSWRSSLRNFINQMSGIIIPDSDQDRRLPVINLNSAVYKLTEMHDACMAIEKGSASYFPSGTLIQQETNVLQRLLKTVLFYIHRVKNNLPMNVTVPSREATSWYIEDQQAELKELHRILDEAEESTSFVFYKPDRILQEDNLKSCFIGVSNFDILNEEQSFELSLKLFELADTGIHFFTIVIVDEKKEVSGGFRVNNDYFQKFKDLLNDEPVTDSDWGNPLPVFPNESTIASLAGIKLKPSVKIPANDIYFSILMNCWKLSESRNRLDKNTETENKWLKELENEFSSAILKDIELIYSDTAIEEPSRQDILGFLSGSLEFTKEKIVNYMNEKALKLSTH